MDLLDHLTQEHRKTEAMLRTLAQSSEGPERESTVAQLDESLRMHMAVEERFLYPIVTEVLGEETETEAETEHGLTRDGLAKLSELVTAPGFAAAVEMLQAGVGHHVKDEEQEVFPKLREKAAEQIAALDPEELEQKVKDSGGPGSGGSGGSDEGPTKQELYEEAKRQDVDGRSKMSKDELAKAVGSS